MATYNGKYRQVPKINGNTVDAFGRDIMNAPRHQSPNKNLQPMHSGKRRVEFEPGEVVRKGNIALDGAPKRLQSTTPVNVGSHRTHRHEHVSDPSHGQTFNLAGISSTQAASALLGDRDPTALANRTKVLPAPKAAWGQRTPGGLNNELSSRILDNAVLSGSTAFKTGGGKL
jgi:hypothetical protein